MKNQRPKNLNLFTIRFPAPAIVSILHRVSGVITFLLIPFLLWALSLSLASQQDFDNLLLFLSSPVMKFIVWGFLSAFLYHLVAGIRHLLTDVNIGIEKKSGKISAYLVLGIAAILILITAIWLA